MSSLSIVPTFSYSICVYRDFDLETFKYKTKHFKNSISIIHNTNEFLLKIFFSKELTANEENELVNLTFFK